MKLTATMMVTLDGVCRTWEIWEPYWPLHDSGDPVSHGINVLRDLVDELNLRICPVVVGAGLRLFPEQGQTHDLTLVESRSTPSGVMLQTYRLAGRATFGNADE
jgi:hypothetical protein